MQREGWKERGKVGREREIERAYTRTLCLVLDFFCWFVKDWTFSSTEGGSTSSIHNVKHECCQTSSNGLAEEIDVIATIGYLTSHSTY